MKFGAIRHVKFMRMPRRRRRKKYAPRIEMNILRAFMGHRVLDGKNTGGKGLKIKSEKKKSAYHIYILYCMCVYTQIRARAHTYTLIYTHQYTRISIYI